MSNGIARDLPRTQMLLVKKYEKAIHGHSSRSKTIGLFGEQVTGNKK